MDNEDASPDGEEWPAESRDAEAMFRQAYSLGATEPERATRLYAQAASLGCAPAMHNVAVGLADSDPAGAERWWKQAAASGHVPSIAASLGSVEAMLALGSVYWRSDRQASQDWYRCAVEAGDASAMYWLAFLLDPCDLGTIFRHGRFREASELLACSARAGDVRGETWFKDTPRRSGYAVVDIPRGVAEIAVRGIRWSRHTTQAKRHH